LIGKTQATLKKEVDKRLQIIPLKKLKRAPWNFKQDNEEAEKRAEESIKRRGQISLLRVRELKDGFYEVIDGNHRIGAMQHLGFSHAIVWNHGNITVAEAQLLAHLALPYFQVDLFKQLPSLETILMEQPDFPDIMPYDQESFERLRALSEEIDLEDFNLPPEEPQGPSTVEEQTRRLVFFVPFQDANSLIKRIAAVAEARGYKGRDAGGRALVDLILRKDTTGDEN